MGLELISEPDPEDLDLEDEEDEERAVVIDVGPGTDEDGNDDRNFCHIRGTRRGFWIGAGGTRTITRTLRTR